MQSIKRITKALIITMLVLFLLPVGAYFILSNDSVQQKLIHKLTATLSKAMNAQVSIRDIDVHPDLRITLHDVCIKIWNDTLIYSKETTTSIEDLDIKNKIFHLGNTVAIKGYFHMIQNSKTDFNINVMVDALSSNSTDTTQPSLNLIFDNIKTYYSSFHLSLYGRNFDKRGVDYANLSIDNVAAKVDNLKVFKSTVSMNIQDLSFLEKSGFMANRMSLNLFIGKGDLRFGNVCITTPHSDIKTDHLYFHASGFNKYGDFLNVVKLDYKFLKSKVSFKDISYFAPQLKGVTEKFTMSGHFKGTIADFKGDHIFLRYGKQTVFEGDGDMNGLPDINNTYMYFNAHYLKTHYDDIQQLVAGFKQDTNFVLPIIISRLGNIQYKGKYTGFYNDFVAYGNFETALGIVNTDILLKPQQNDMLSFQGSVQTIGLNVGALIQNNIIGNIDLNARFDGSVFNKYKDVNAIIQCTSQALQFNQYTYHNIEMNGEFLNRSFNGNVSIDDTNAKVDFKGSLDFSKKISEHHFMLDIIYANLYNLNVIKKDTDFTFGCKIKADFQGNNVDNLNGSVTILNALFNKSNQKYQLNNAVLSVSSSSDSSQIEKIEFNSDLVDINLNGRYDFKTLIPSISNEVRKYLPNLIIDSLPVINNDNDFTFTAYIKKTKSFTSFFIPDLKLAENTFVNGVYNPDKNDVNVAITGDYFAYKSTKIDNFTLATKSSDSIIEVNFGCDELNVKEKLQFKRMYLSNVISKNTISTYLNWKNSDTSMVNEGMSFSIDIGRNKLSKRPLYLISSDPSNFTIMNERWSINKTMVVIDSNTIDFRACDFEKGKQKIYLSGKISSNPTDTFSCYFKNLQLSTVNLLLDKKIVKLDGIANGNLHLMNAYNKPMLITDLQVEHFSLNDEDLGDGIINAHWVDNEKKINVEVQIANSFNQSLNIDGYYTPSDSRMNFNIVANKLKLRPIGMYLKNIITISDGVASGKLVLNGTTDYPLLNGQLNVQRFYFGVDFLKTKYALSTPVTIENNKFSIKNGIAFDDNAKEARIQAWLFLNRFREISFDISVDAKEVMFLNTKETDNDYFYGRAYGTGVVKIYGTPANVVIDVNAKSDRLPESNTHVCIPLKTGDVQEKKFITFVKRNDFTKEQSENTIDLKVQQKNNSSGLKLSINIEATPDAEVEIIFDPIIGDALNAKGSGIIRLEIDNLGKFMMYGRYIIEEGEYNFSLKNIISKRLVIDKGGIIEWNGDPLDANLDLKTIYHTRASLEGVIPQQAGVYKTKVPVDCWLYLTGKLLNPTLRYDINLPNATEDTKSKLRTVLTNDELSKQFMWLLVSNSFYADPSRVTNPSGSTNTPTNNASIDILSKQLLGNNPWDLGMRIGSGNYELGMSRQLLNDRVSISGNIDYVGNKTNTTNTTLSSNNPYLQNKVMGDFNLDVKITDDGRFRFKAFNRANEQYATTLYNQGLHKQGVGLMYHEEFNTFGDLLRSYKRKIFKSDTTKTGKEK